MNTINSNCPDAELSAAGVPVAGYPDYTVNKAGEVFRHTFKNKVVYKRLDPPLKLKPKITNKGYLSVGLWLDGVKRDRLVHRIVMIAYGGDCPDGNEVAHNDGNRANPAFTNLRWASHKENQSDMVRHGTLARGVKNGARKLTEVEAVEIFDLARKNPNTSGSISRKYGISRTTVQLIAKGKRWARTLKANGWKVEDAP